MTNKSSILILVSVILISTSGCGVPECTLIIYDATEEELLKDLKEYSLSEDVMQDIITREAFNNLISQEAQEVVLNVMNSDEVTCDSIRLTNDSLICNNEDKIILFSINDINQIEVFYEDRTLSLLKNSAIIGTFTSSIGLLGYIPPNPPQPDWKGFVGLFGAGFIAGIIFDVSSSSYYCLISKESFLRFAKENKEHIIQNGI